MDTAAGTDKDFFTSLLGVFIDLCFFVCLTIQTAFHLIQFFRATNKLILARNFHPPCGSSLEYWCLLVMVQEIEPPRHKKTSHKVEIWQGMWPTTVETLSTDTAYLSFGYLSFIQQLFPDYRCPYILVYMKSPHTTISFICCTMKYNHHSLACARAN